jgi:anti-sigma factor RsiW
VDDDFGLGRPSRGAADLHALSAFADNELPPRERKTMFVRLVSDSEAALHVAAYRAQKTALSILCRDTCEPTSAIIVRHRSQRWCRGLEAFAYLVVGAALGLAWVVAAGGRLDESAGFARRADSAYATYAPELVHPVEVSADDKDHLVQWLSARFGRQLPVPSLRDYGYSLIGGRLVPDEHGPAALLMYESTTCARLTLYVAALSRRAIGYGLYRSSDRSTSYWVKQGTAYAVTGNVTDAQLQAMVGEIEGTQWSQ